MASPVISAAAPSGSERPRKGPPSGPERFWKGPPSGPERFWKGPSRTPLHGVSRSERVAILTLSVSRGPPLTRSGS